MANRPASFRHVRLTRRSMTELARYVLAAVLAELDERVFPSHQDDISVVYRHFPLVTRQASY